MSARNGDLIQAVELALAGQWDAAHERVQHHEDDPGAAWIRNLLR